MKKQYLFILALLSFLGLDAQFFPAEGIGYQAMLSKAETLTYGAKLKQIPVSNKDIRVRFELLQNGAVVFNDAHELTTDISGMFSCVIGMGNTSPVGLTLSSLPWGKDSMLVKVYVNQGEGEALFSEQKLWSSPYAMYAHTAGIAMNDKDTNSTNELQYLNLVGDSIKLTAVTGGISLKPWSDAISNNSQAITAEKSRAEAAELALQSQISGINASLGNKTTELSAAQDTLVKFRSEINALNNAVSQNQNTLSSHATDIAKHTNSISQNTSDITKNTSDINDLSDSISVHRSELNKNQSDITKNATAINQNKTDIATNKSNISTNASDIATNKTGIATNKTDISNNTTSIRKNSDTLVVHRTELNKNRGDINKNTAAIAQNKTDIATNKSNISTNATDIGTNKSGITTNKTDISNNTTSIRKNSDTLVVHRTELNKNRGDINKNTAAIAKNKTDLAQHVNNDKDTDNTNELSDLSYNSTTFELNLSNPSTTGNKVDLSGLRDNLGNHKATDTLDLNGQVLTDRSGDSLMIAVSGNDIDLTLESEDEIFIRTVNNPNNATHGDIQLESSDEVIIEAETDVHINAEEDIDIVGNDDVTIEALGDDITLESSDDIHFNSGEDIFLNASERIELNTDGGYNLTLNSDNDIELITTDNDYVEIWKKNASGNKEFMYTLPNNRGSVGQFIQRSADGGSEYFTDWSTYKLPTSDGTNGQGLVTDGNGNVTWGTSGDNLGNHKATQNIELNGKYLSNDGGNEGVSISNTGQVGIGTNAPDASAILDISSTTQGVLMPRMTESQRNQITKPANGSIIFNTTNNKLEIFTDSVNGDFIQTGSRALYDGPYHLQSFRPKTSGLLFELNCQAGIRFNYSGYLECNLYSGDPSTGLTLIGQADNKKLLRNPTGISYQKESVKFTFSSLNTTLTPGNTYTFGFVIKDSTTGAARQSWFYVNNSTSNQNPDGEYWKGSNMSSLTQPSNIDMAGSILLKVAPPNWIALNETEVGFTEIDGSTSNELQDLSFNSTTKKLTLSTPKTTGNEVDLSSLGGASKLDDLSDVKGPNTNFNKSLLIGNTTTGTLNNANGNVGMGHLVLSKLSSGDNNTVIGAEAGMDIEASFNNTLIGYQAGHKVSTQSYNTAIGATALFRNSAGQQNVAVGQGAGSALLGSFTTSIGTGAASGNSSVTTNSGDNNTYIGFGAQPTSSTVSNEIVLGNQSVTNVHTAGKLKTGTVTYPNTHNSSNGQVLTVDASGNATWQSASGGGASKLDDLSDVKGPTTNFGNSLLIGTTTTGTLNSANDNIGIGNLVISKVTSGAANTVIGSQSAQNLSSGSRNVTLGYRAAQNITTSSNNVVIGNEAAQKITTSGDNTVIGYKAMQNASGVNAFWNVAIGTEALKNAQSNQNTAIGYQSLMNFTIKTLTQGWNTAVGSSTGSKITTGVENSMFGSSSQFNSTTGYKNSSFGNKSLLNLTEGYQNCAFGYNSGSGLTTGYSNTSMGYNSFYTNTTGVYNVAIGVSSLGLSTTSSYNVAVGGSALYRTTTGERNTGIGQGAGNQNTTGYHNTFIGNEAGGTNSGTLKYMQTGFNNVYIGYQSRPTSNSASNEIVLGNSSVTELYTTADMNAPNFTTTSDRRLKKNIQPLGSALEKVMQLNPVIYDKKRHMTSENYDIHEIGFIAQELQQEFPEVVSEQPDENHILGVNYQALIPVLTKATQEQQIQIEEQKATIKAQQKVINDLLKRVETLEKK